MCAAPDIKLPPPPPAPPPVLEQAAPRSAGGSTAQSRLRSGLSRYKIADNTTGNGRTAQLGGIPKKAGV